MKQIITVLAILISGIASAQSTWITSVCDGKIVHNENRYEVLGNLLSEDLQGRIPGGANFSGFFCLENDITNADNYNRYFRWYCNSERLTRSGNSFTRNTTNDSDKMTNYLFINHPTVRYQSISIRVYPDTYSDGLRYDDHLGRPTQGISNVIERAKQSMFEVRTGATGSSRLSDPDRLHASAQDAWDYAITH